MSSKKTSNNNRVYFISSKIDDDYNNMNKYLIEKRIDFIDKIYKSKIKNNENTTDFLNVKINIQLTEEEFIKLAKKINEILKTSYKIFYKDTLMKQTYIPEEIIDKSKKSFNLFINDEQISKNNY